MLERVYHSSVGLEPLLACTVPAHLSRITFRSIAGFLYDTITSVLRGCMKLRGLRGTGKTFGPLAKSTVALGLMGHKILATCQTD